MSVISLGCDRALLLLVRLHLHESQRMHLAEEIRCKKFESCLTGRHVRRVGTRKIDRNTISETHLPCHACQVCKLLKNGQMLPATIRHVLQLVYMVHRLVLVRHTHMQLVESRKTRGYLTGIAIGG
jgi:hypothetical protein